MPQSLLELIGSSDGAIDGAAARDRFAGLENLLSPPIAPSKRLPALSVPTAEIAGHIIRPRRTNGRRPVTRPPPAANECSDSGKARSGPSRLPARSSVTINTERPCHTTARVDRAVTRKARQHSNFSRSQHPLLLRYLKFGRGVKLWIPTHNPATLQDRWPSPTNDATVDSRDILRRLRSVVRPAAAARCVAWRAA